MMSRVVSAACLLAAFALFAGGMSLSAGEKKVDKKTIIHEGEVVKVEPNKLYMETKGQEHTHKVPATAKITLNGKQAKLEDLKPGYHVRVTTPADNLNLAIRIEAKSKKGAKNE